LAALLGGMTDRTSEGDLTCSTWTRSSFYNGMVRRVICNGRMHGCSPYNRDISVRPALPPWETSKISPSKVKTIKGIRVAEYGEYPQMVADEQTSEELERRLESRSLRPTGKNYTFDSTDSYEFGTPFKATTCPEYELDGKKYIRVLGNPYDAESRYWVQVQPIEWLVDESGWMVSKKCLFAGIQFDTGKYYDGDFSKTFMKKYLDTYFAKEIGHEEIVARHKVLTGLSARLEEATSDEAVEAIKRRLMEAEKRRKTKTPSNRLHEAARIKRLRNARDILNEAAQQAYDAGDRALLDGIIELSSTYAARYQGQQNRVAQRRATRRAQRKQADR